MNTPVNFGSAPDLSDCQFSVGGNITLKGGSVFGWRQHEWAYGWTYQNSAERTDALAGWQHHYNWHRPHSGIGRMAPMDRLKSANNLLTVHN